MMPLGDGGPYALYQSLYAQDPVLHAPHLMGVGAWLVTSHAVCSTVLRSKQRFVKQAETLLPEEKLALLPRMRGERAERRKTNMLFVDPPVHTRLRGLVSRAFTPATIEQLRPRVRAIAEELVDAMGASGSGDLIGALAYPLPVIVIAELLGVPASDRERFKAWATVLTRAVDPNVTEEELERVEVAVAELNEYLMPIVEERRRAPRDDLLSGLVRAHDASDTLSLDELLATCRLLLTAGHETTANLVGNGTLALLRHPEQRAALAADASLLPNAIEELLRWDAPVQLTMRFASEDAELGAHVVRRGDMVVTLLGAANRDPAVFERPGELDLRRANAREHLAFGGGIHFCLGAALARLEGETAIEALVRKRPTLALADDELRWRTNPAIRGLQTLPVRW